MSEYENRDAGRRLDSGGGSMGEPPRPLNVAIGIVVFVSIVAWLMWWLGL